MEFSQKAKNLLKHAGWYEGRNISLQKLKLPYNDYPQNVISFLLEFGNIEGECAKQSYTEIVNSFFISPNTDVSILTEDNYYPYYSKILNKKLFPLGGYLPEGYYICCDTDSRVYMVGEYCYCWGVNLYEGIERILLGNWRNTLQLDDDSGKWWNNDAQYVSLP